MSERPPWPMFEARIERCGWRRRKWRVVVTGWRRGAMQYRFGPTPRPFVGRTRQEALDEAQAWVDSLPSRGSSSDTVELYRSAEAQVAEESV
jgi:hypothetical protein